MHQGQKNIAIALALLAIAVGLVTFGYLACAANAPLNGAYFLAGWTAIASAVGALANLEATVSAGNANPPPSHPLNVSWLLIAAGVVIFAAAVVTLLLVGKLAAPAPSATVEPKKPVVWTQLRPDTNAPKGQLIARAIVARDQACPQAIIAGTPQPMDIRADGSNPDFSIKLCEIAFDGNAEARIGDVKLKPRPRNPKKILVIGDTGCRITDYAAQRCDSATDWPLARVAEVASKTNPDLIIHVGDYHYREKPCAGRAGCSNSPYGDNWPTWNAEFFTPAAPLLTAAPWLMVRGNHENCPRAGAGWQLLLRSTLGLPAGALCPADSDPGVIEFDGLRLVALDTASAEDYRRDKRATIYRKQIRDTLARLEAMSNGETWLLLHQPLWASSELKNDKPIDEKDLYDSISKPLDAKLLSQLCQENVNPLDAFRQWFAGRMTKTAPDKESTCDVVQAAPENMLPSPDIALVLSGHAHIFQMFVPDDIAGKKQPLQLVVGNGGDALEQAADFPEADKKLIDGTGTLFGLTGKLWARNTFGFVVLEKPSDNMPWIATLHDINGKPIVKCDLKPTDRGKACNALP